MPQVTLKKQNEIVIAATSDLHGHLEGIRQVCDDNNVDILIIAGDIQPADIYYHCNDTACGHWFRNTFFKKVKSLDCEVVAIPGNHDFWLNSLLHGEFGTPSYCTSKFFIPDNFHLLCDSEIIIKGLRIFGSPWVPFINGRWCFERHSLLNTWDAIPDGLDVLVTHTPPSVLGSDIDVSLDNDPRWQRHFGDHYLGKRIRDRSPTLAICGHIHSGDHDCLRIHNDILNRDSCVYNVSRVNERYSIAYPLRILSIGNGSVSEINPDSSALK